MIVIASSIYSLVFLFLLFQLLYTILRTSLVSQMVKHLSTMRETRARFLGWEDPLEKEMAIHSRNIAWKIPWTEEPGRLQSMESQESDMTERLSLFNLKETFRPESSERSRNPHKLVETCVPISPDLTLVHTHIPPPGEC